jgi:flagellar basal-body rod modification protein FlgD
MDLLQMNSIATSGAAAAGTVASALSPRHAAVQATAKATTASTSSTTTGGTSAAAANPSNITSNDFLTLLVSELKNQDPTQPTDPNAYISQLVGVNSLQQLISINQGLTSIETSPTTAPTPAAVSGASST